MGLSEADSQENIVRYLDRNPYLICVARDGNMLMGAILCDHDGRRGYIHHLAVTPPKKEPDRTFNPMDLSSLFGEHSAM